jgi:hypothetical protein
MTRLLILVTAIVLLGEQAGAGSDAVTLVRDGRPASVIVTADEPTPAARQGASDLQMWLERASGATVPIRTESQMPQDPNIALVLVGDTKRTRAQGIKPDELQLEEHRVRSFPGTLVLIGDDARADGVPLQGTCWAVDAFAERVLGVRLLWPGELGEVVPRRATIEVRDLDLREKPLMVQRIIRDQGFNGVTHSKLDALGWDRAAYYRFQEPSRVWHRFHRLGTAYHGDFGHSYGDYWDRFHKSHPEWFALQPDGTRDNSEPGYTEYPGAQLCVSNAELIRQVAADCIVKLKKSPTLDTVSVAPNDDGSPAPTHCLCARCQAWDDPQGKVVRMGSRKGPVRHVSMTDRYVRFFNAVAEIVAQEQPNRSLGSLAYSVYELPPLHTKLHDRVIIGFVPPMDVYANDQSREEMRQNWLKWADAAEHLFYRPNALMALHALPAVYVHRLGEDMRLFADHKMMFVDFDCQYQHWATNGLNYYVITKLVGDPHRDVDEIVDEYCTVGFGPAASTVRRYFDETERITNAFAAERQRPTPRTIARHYSDENLARLRAILDQAERAAGDGIVKQRIAFLRQGLDYAPLSRDYQLAKEAGVGGDKWQWRKYTEEFVRRVTYFQKLGPSWAIHAPWLLYWDR